MSRKMRTVSQVIEVIKNLKKVSTNSGAAKLLGIPRTLASPTNRERENSNELIEGLITFAEEEHLSMDYLMSDIDC
jgi:hypothetical protein